jgi:hypothetical protein
MRVERAYKRTDRRGRHCITCLALILVALFYVLAVFLVRSENSAKWIEAS